MHCITIQPNLCDEPVLDPLQVGYHLHTTSTAPDDSQETGAPPAVTDNYYPVNDQQGYNCTVSQ